MQTIAQAALAGGQLPFANLLEVLDDGSSGKTGGAHDQTNIFWLAIEIILLECHVRVALFGTDETAGHLNGVSSLSQSVLYIGPIPDATCGDNRNLGLPGLPEIGFDGSYRSILIVLAGADIFQLFTEMTTGGIGIFDHHRIGEATEIFMPFTSDQFCRTT